MRKPNFFIVGAPKCGTTALSEYLREHPQVFMSRPKEPHYFATDLPKYRYTDIEENYLELFSDAKDTHCAVGEASVWYLYSKEAIANIRAFDAAAKLIVMVRNPVDMVYSMHSQALFNLAESESDFSKAWSLSESRKAGKRVPKNCLDSKILHYDEIGRFGSQLNCVLEIFPAEQVKVILFDDFISDTKGVYSEVLEFLGLMDDQREKFPRVNENKQLKIRAPATENTPSLLVKPYRQIRALTGLGGLGLWTKLVRWNRERLERPPLDDRMKNKIIQTYRSDILKLARITNKNLDHWIDPKPS